MHSTDTWSSHSERKSRMPCMRWALSRLRAVLPVLPAALLPVRKRRRLPKRQRVWPQREAALVVSQFVSRVYTC
jgi:hypothetical protein